MDVLTTLVAFLKANGNRQALLSETGGGNTDSCETKWIEYLLNSAPANTSLCSLDSELAFVKANADTLIGFTIWSAGSFDTTYVLTVTPNSDGSDQPLWTGAGKQHA